MSFSEDFRAVIGQRQTHRGVRSHASLLRRSKSRRERSRAQRHYERALLSWRLPGAIPTLSDSSASVAAPAVSQAPRSRLGSSDRLTLRDVVRLGTFNCRTLLSEVRQQELVRFMESRQIHQSCSAEGNVAATREVTVMSEYPSHDKY